jgi:hypothetical protein
MQGNFNYTISPAVPIDLDKFETGTLNKGLYLEVVLGLGLGGASEEFSDSVMCIYPYKYQR